MTPVRTVKRVAGFGLVSLLAATSASAQAWAPPAGQGAFTVAFQAIDNTGHILTDGSTVPGGKSQSASIYLEFEYAITDRWSLSTFIPYVFAKFSGPPLPNVPLQPGDACQCWQHGWQDFGVAARYNLLNGGTALTPSVAFGVPSHEYGYVGEAVLGRRLRELRLGVDVGTYLDAISPRLAVQGRYAYALVERVLDVSTNRSSLSADVIVRLTESLSVQGSVYRQITHGGLRAGTEPPPPPDGIPWGEVTTPELLHEHDRLLRDNSWQLGAGLSYSLPRADLFVSYIEFLSGSDTHAGRAFTVGATVPFERSQP